jgi:hypothetical protein
MVRVQVNDKTYSFSFAYGEYTPEDNAPKLSHYTTAKVEEVLGPNPDPNAPVGQKWLTKPVGMGIAYCSVKDQFRKTTGRKVALGRALRDSALTYAERAAFWDTLLHHTDFRKD